MRRAIVSLAGSLLLATAAYAQPPADAAWGRADAEYKQDIRACFAGYPVKTDAEGATVLKCYELAERRFAASIGLKRPDLLETYLRNVGEAFRATLAPGAIEDPNAVRRLRAEYLAAIKAH